MNKKDLSNLSKIYTEKVLEEININPNNDFGDIEGSKFGRFKGRHFKKPENKEIPQSRKDYIPSVEREINHFTDSEYEETFGEEENGTETDVPEKTKLAELSREERTEIISRMAILRSEIDDYKNESEQIKNLSINRKLMDEVISDLVLGFSRGSVSLTHVSKDGDPIFTTENENICVSFPYEKYTNPEDVVYKKVNI
jgi:hypothetical protein